MSKVTKKASKKNGKAASKPQKAAKPQAANQTNPYRVGGGYWASVEALRTLGVGKMHSQASVVAAVKKAFGDGWKAFADKDARNEATGKDADARVWQNVAVVARKDYGKCLREVGFEVRFDGRKKEAGLFKM